MIPQPCTVGNTGAAEIVEVIDSGDEADLICCDTQSSASTASFARPVARPMSGESLNISTVSCPVCGRSVPLHEAEQHVNAHYDDPAALVSSRQSTERAAKFRGTVKGKKR